MASWSEVAAEQGWRTTANTVRVVLGTRKQTVRVVDASPDLEFYSGLPVDVSDDDLLEMLEANRSAGVAFWHITDRTCYAMSMCPEGSSKEVMAHYLRETAALADRYELRVSEVDR